MWTDVSTCWLHTREQSCGATGHLCGSAWEQLLGWFPKPVILLGSFLLPWFHSPQASISTRVCHSISYPGGLASCWCVQLQQDPKPCLVVLQHLPLLSALRHPPPFHATSASRRRQAYRGAGRGELSPPVLPSSSVHLGRPCCFLGGGVTRAGSSVHLGHPCCFLGRRDPGRLQAVVIRKRHGGRHRWPNAALRWFYVLSPHPYVRVRWHCLREAGVEEQAAVTTCQGHPTRQPPPCQPSLWAQPPLLIFHFTY